jgi:hypothetical protein
VTVFTNDEMNSTINLTITGNVERFVTIIPKKPLIAGVEGQNLQTIIKIIPEKKYPFKILDIIGNEKLNFSYNLEEVDMKSSQIEYILKIQNLMKNKGSYSEDITLKTDSILKPVIKIHVNGIIREKMDRAEH